MTDIHILLCGYYFQGNTGDDILMEAIVETLRKHGEVKVTSTENFDVELLNWCQLLIIGAGSLVTPRGIGGGKHAKYAKENGKKVVYYSQTIEEGHPQLKEHLARADLITVRDSESKRVVEANGFRAVLASDPIFKKKKRTIGFSFRKWVNEPPDIIERLAAMLDNLAIDYEIFSLPYTERDTDTESDTAFHEQIIRHMKNKPKQTAYADAIEKVDLFIGMRLHALINAVNQGKKVLAINYDAKVGRIFADLSMSDRVISYEQVENIPWMVRNRIFKSDALALREQVNEALIARMCADIKREPSPKVSIVMPTYNRAHYLKEAIDSIVAQTMTDWELILIDDGSSDNTRELVESYNNVKIKYYNFGHNGITFSRNIGNLLSRGEIIVVADSDDINLPNRLEVTLEEMGRGQADILYSSMFHFDDTGKRELIPSHPFSYERLKEGNFIYHPTVAYRREVAMSCPYNEDLEMVEDYHLYLQAAEKGYKFHQVEEPLAMHRLHEGQISSARSEEMAEIHRKLVDSTKEEKEKVRDPLVSVIVPTYNRPDLLKEALVSIFSQTYPNFEIIVVNDAGEDVKAVIDPLNQEGKIIYLQHKENRGLPAARNTGLKAAKGKYIAYLDDDDIYYPHHLETLVGFLENSDYRVAYTDSYHAFQEWITDRYVTVARKVIFSKDFDRKALLVSNYFPVINVVHQKDILNEVGFFDETLNAHEDWDLWIRISQQCDFYHIKTVTAEVRTRSDATTMTSRDRIPFLKTLQEIHARYSYLVTENDIFEAQKRVEEGLAREVEMRQMSSDVMEYGRLHHYRFAKEFVKDKKVLVLGSGKGYGSFILSEDAKSVTCIETNEYDLRHASSNYIKDNLEFIKGSITDASIIKEEKIFDVIVCFGAFEQIEEHDELMKEVKRLLKDDGIFIVSTPNKDVFSEQGDYPKSPRSREIPFDEFRSLIKNHFKNALIYGQKVYPSSNIFPLFRGPGTTRDYTIEKSGKDFMFVPPERKEARYLIAVASDGQVTEIMGNSYLVDVSETLFKLKGNQIRILEAALRDKDTHLGNLEAVLRDKDAHLGNLETALKNKEVHLAILETAVREKETQIRNLEGVIREKETTLNHIYNSHGWKALLVYYKVRDKIFPMNSRRRKSGKMIWNFVSRFRDKRSDDKHNKTTCEADPILQDASENDSYGDELEESTSIPALYTDENVYRSEVAVILVNYNCGKYVAPFFSSLRKQTLPPKEVILFDNGSTDGSLEFISKEYPEVRIVRNERNLGFSLPNNLGIRQTLSEYILLSNLDVVLDCTFIEQMVIPLQRDSSIGWVAGKVYKLTDQGPTKDVDCFAHHIQRDRYANALSIRHPDPNDPYYQKPGVRWGAPACCALYRRQMLEEIRYQEEYFDEDFFAYFEDVDLDWRANLYGWKCYYQPLAIAYHVREGSKMVLDPKIMAGLVMNRFFMMIKNDRLLDILKDFFPIMKGTLFAFRRMLKECPSAIFYLFQKLTLIPKMLRKRRWIFSRRKATTQEIRKWFDTETVRLGRKKDKQDILIFPVGPLNARLELSKRIKMDHPHSLVTLLLRRDEMEMGPLPRGLRTSSRPFLRYPLCYLKKPAVIPIYHNAWRKDFLKMASLAFLSGASPISVYGENGEVLEKNFTSIFLGEFRFILLTGILYPFARVTRSFLPLISKLRHKDRGFSRAEKTWFIIPIYPDLSHHFIFQQVLHLSQLIPSEVVSVLKGDPSYRAHYMKPLDQRIKYLPFAERLCVAAIKGFILLAFTRPRKLLEACLKIEDAAREEGEKIWSLRGFLSPFNPLNGLALYLLSKGQIPKMIHTYGLTIPTNYGLFFSMVFDVPLTATYYIDIPKGIPSRFFRLKKERLERVIVHTRHCIQELEKLMHIPPEMIEYIPFGTSITDTAPIDGVNHPTELLSVGRLIPKKGIHILIGACEILKRKGYYLPCLIVGNGPELPHLQAAVRKAGLENRVIFLGSKGYDDYLSLLKPHRILVQPSVIAESGDHDGIPSVILDGMARGLIVIGTRIGGIPEVIHNEKNGFLVPANDPKALAECIEKVLATREIHQQISQNAKLTILEHYDVKNLSKKMAEKCGFIASRSTAEWPK